MTDTVAPNQPETSNRFAVVNPDGALSDAVISLLASMLLAGIDENDVMDDPEGVE